MTALDQTITIPVPERDWVLEGILSRAEAEEPGGAVVAPPHPLYGGSMDNPVVTEVAWACRQAGFAALRFNWRGVGASGGETSGDPADADADYGAALHCLADGVPGPLLAAGYSFGAAAALRRAATSPRVRRVLLVAPPAAMLDAAALEALRARLLVLVGERDAFAPVAELRARLGQDDPRRRLEVVPEADHFFGMGLGDIGPRVRDWLDETA